MPLPLIPLVLISGASLVAATYYIAKHWDAIKKKLKGKSIVILGQRATGKTTLLNFLQKGEITLKHTATTGISKVEKTKMAKKKLAELDWTVKLAKIQKDYGGGETNYDQWLGAAKTADIFIYLFKIDEWVNNAIDIENRIEKDLNGLSEILFNRNIPIFIIGTHLDKLVSVEFSNEHEKLKFIDAVQNEVFLKNIKHRLNSKENKAHFHIGSMESDKGLSEVVCFMIDQLVDR